MSPGHEGGGTVLLVHGLWLNAGWMRPLANKLTTGGWRVECHAYPSCRRTLEANTAALAGRILRLRQSGPVHLVGHSLGGVVAFGALLEAGEAPGMTNRLVMLGSPFQGSHCATRLSAHSWLAPVFGRTLGRWLQLSHPEAPPWLEVGVIAGRQGVGLGRLLVPSLPEPNDGVVAVEETVVPGARDSICIRVSHMAMLVSRRCAFHAGHFLEYGRFLHDQAND